MGAIELCPRRKHLDGSVATWIVGIARILVEPFYCRCAQAGNSGGQRYGYSLARRIMPCMLGFVEAGGELALDNGLDKALK